MHRHLSSVLSGFLALLFFSSACFGDAVPQRLIAYKSQAAPGTGGGDFTRFGIAALNNRGNVAFWAEYLGFGVPGNRAIFVDRDGALQPYLFKGDDSPINDTQSGLPLPFGNFGDPNINDAGANGQGHLIFNSLLGNTGDTVVWVQTLDDHLDYDNNGLIGIARTNTEAPGTGGANFFQVNFGNSGEHYRFNDQGRTAFEATLAHDGQSNRRGLWHYDGTQLQLVVLDGQTVPKLPGATHSIGLGVSLNQSNQLLFKTGLAGEDYPGGAVWKSDDGATPSLLTIDIEDPDTNSGTEFRSSTPFSWASTGQMSYIASFDLAPSNDTGISIRPGGGAVLRSKRDGAYPGLQQVLLESGQVIFIGTQSNPNLRGIYRAFGAAAPIVVQNQQAPDQPDGVVFNIFDNLTGNPAGKLAFQARLTGGGTTSLTDRVLYCANIDGSMELIAREGDVLTLEEAENPDDSVIVTLSSVLLMPIGQNGGNGMDGHRRRMNERGQVLWQAGFRFNSPASMNGQTGELIMVSECGPPSGNQLVLPTGVVQGHIDSLASIATNSGLKVERSRVTLTPQTGYIRDQGGSETNEEYRQFVEQKLRSGARTQELDIPDRGRFLFGGVPLVEIDAGGPVRVNRRAYYTVRVNRAESDEIVLDSTNTVNFTSGVAHNVLAQTISPPDTAYLLEPLDVIDRKETLIADLIARGPNHYMPVEVQVQSFLDSIKADPTDEQIEAVQRAELAEQLFKLGLDFSDSLLGTMLDSLTVFLHALVDKIGDGNSALKDKRKVYGTLKEELDFAKLQSRGFKGFSGGNSQAEDLIRQQIKNLMESNPDLARSVYGELFSKGGDAIFAQVKSSLISTGVAEGPATEVANAMKLMFDTVMASVITQGLAGTAKPIIKAAITSLVKSSKAGLIDSPASYSFTALTQPTLDSSRQLMQPWDTDDYVAFLQDRREFWLIRDEMGHQAVTVAGAITAYSNALTTAMGDVRADIIGLLGPLGRATNKAMVVLKYVSNGVSFAVPFINVYGVIGGEESEVNIPLPRLLNLYGRETFFTYKLGYLQRGVKAAYGTDTLPAAATESSTPLNRNQATHPWVLEAQQQASSAISGALNTSSTELDSVLDDLQIALADDDIPASIELTSGDGGTSLLDAFAAFQSALSDVISEKHGTDFAQQTAYRDFEDLVDAEIDLRIAFTDLLEEIESLFTDVLLLEYENPVDLLYQVERQHLLALLSDFRARVADIDSEANALSALYDSAETQDLLALSAPLPAVVISDLSLLSDASGEPVISNTAEHFTLSMKVRNIGAEAVNNLSAELGVVDLENTISINESLVQVVGTGSLAANDAAPGGADEAMLTWTFLYDGDPTQIQRILFFINLLESGTTPLSFRPFSEAAILMPDVEIYDADLDGMPDQWEMDHGLNPALDDAREDAEGDGLENIEELELGTDPQLADSDDDELDDNEEVVPGLDGFVTDPTLEDTDGDGIDDKLDGAPLDAGSTGPTDRVDLIAEPQVMLSASNVSLSQSSPTAIVLVMNSGDGLLNWTAVSDNPAIAVVNPALPTVTAGERFLQVAASPTFDFGAGGTVSTRIRVFDAAGNEQDYQELLVTVGEVLPEQIFLDGFEN